ncbi:MAG: DUF3786 domain-containing protein [Sedimentisphaerales bacterium]|nr:DUF3786 domain-containing protein [Sedimentisphaerales bacterium]
MSNEGLWEKLQKLDGAETAQRAKCEYLSDKQHYIIILLNIEYIVDLIDKKIYSNDDDSPQKPAPFLEELCLLAYLINAKEIPIANKLVRAEVLPGGQFFFRGIHKLPVEKLEKTFGEHPQALLDVAEQFNAQKCEFGDASISLYILPRLPLTIVIWRGCEEFQARASVLFDQTAASQMPLDALLVSVNLAVDSLIKAIIKE